MKIFKIAILFLILTVKTYGQNFSNPPMFFLDYNLSTIQVDLLTDQEISKLVNELSKNQIKIDNLKELAISNGMSSEEFIKLKTKVDEFNLTNESDESDESDESELENNTLDYNKYKKKSLNIRKINLEIFGSELFPSNSDIQNLNEYNTRPPAKDYVVGSGDELEIVIHGTQQLNLKSKVLNDGKIRIPNVGYFFVSGLSLESINKKIKKEVSKIYKSINNNSSTLSVNISKLRTINVLVIGALNSGNYLMSSTNTVFDAISLAGGPGENGSFRRVEVIRNNKVYKILDLYQFLSSNSVENNLNLTNNDIIRIPNYLNRVRVKGEVNRPGLFEISENESFSDLINYFQGFSNNAYTNSIKIITKTNKQLRLIDINPSTFKSYKPANGDIIEVERILNKYENRVTISGAIYRPGQYSLNENMRISDLILKADGLKENVNLDLGRLVRTTNDLNKSVINFDLKKVLNDDPNENIVLQKEDKIEIFKNNSEELKVEIYGEILNPGEYIFYEGMNLEDLILKSGGFTLKASDIIEVSSKIISNKITNDDKNLVEIKELKFSTSGDIKLKSYDVINIRRLPNFTIPSLLTIKGEVNYPGKYSIKDYNENISSYILRAGGFTKYANTSSIRIIRKNKIVEKNLSDENLNDVSAFSSLDKLKISNDSIDVDINEDKEITIPIDLDKFGKSRDNIVFEPNDIILVLKKSNGVRVEGEVVLNSEIIFSRNKNLRFYVNSAGGVSASGSLKNSYVVYPNGSAKTTKSFLIFKFFPKVKPGSRVVIPIEKEKSKLSTGELIGLSGMLTSVAGLVISILN
jgi:protein involved in polysaccharide export with SLBB domain